MAYQGYSDQPAQQGYGQSNPYGNPSPYSQQGNPYASEDPYRSGQYDAERAQGYEMGQLNGANQNRIPNECRQIEREIDEVEAQHREVTDLTRAACDESDSAQSKSYQDRAEKRAGEIVSTYSALVARVKRLKQDPESGNPRNAPSVGKTDRRLKGSMNSFQSVERDSRRILEENARRQYLIVRPDASDAEVREALEDSNQGNIFSQALMQGNRRGEAATVTRNVRDRHAAIQKIEQDIVKLAQLFNDLDALVVQQEAAVTQIEQRGEEVTDHATKANTELDGAVKKARAARRKKWMCLGIGVLIVIIIVVVVVVVVEVTKH